MASIKERKGKTGTSYLITVSLGRDMEGKKLRETVTFKPDPSLTPKKREKAVEDFAREFEAKVLNGAAMDGRKTSLKEFSDRWISDVAAQRLQPGTVKKYREELDGKILPALGHYKLSDIRPGNLNSFFVSLTQDGVRQDGKTGGYSKASIMKTRNVLSSILRTAAEWEIIDRNPCDRVRLQVDDTAEKLKYFTPDQTQAFLDFVELPYKVRVGGHERTDDTGKKYRVGDYEVTKELPEQTKILFNLAVYTGCRRGELLALQWSDIDFERDIVSITKAVTFVDGEPVIKPPKTKTSTRTVSIPHSLTLRLKSHRAAQYEYRFKLRDAWKGNDWLFIQEDGKMMYQSTPLHVLKEVIARYNTGKAEKDQLPDIPFHGLRHTSATLLIASRQDVKTVSSRLGHAQTSTTMNIYAHALKESDRRAADALENMLIGGEAQKKRAT